MLSMPHVMRIGAEGDVSSNVEKGE
jgi:hypothetical protein